jgi:hypothetical protein
MAAQVSGRSGQPNISYTPNWDIYQERLKRREETENIDGDLPDGFPKQLDSSMAWHGATVTDEYPWSYELGESDLEEIHQALNAFKRK